MHGKSRSRPPARPAATGVNAVVWIGPDRALVVRGGDGGDVASSEVLIPALPAETPPALAEVAHSIGRVDHVLVLGATDLRTALEREIVAIGHRPETIRDDEIDEPVDRAVLVRRLAELR
jgi:pyrrolidone-carboxylate peptidase